MGLRSALYPLDKSIMLQSDPSLTQMYFSDSRVSVPNLKSFGLRPSFVKLKSSFTLMGDSGIELNSYS
jgi:hypothetical protein